MTPMASRLLVGAIGLPAVLGIVYLGGWWMFTLVAIAAVLALHEYALVIRSLRPLVLAAYAVVSSYCALALARKRLLT